MGGFAGDDGTMAQFIAQKDTQTMILASTNSASFYYETGFCPNFRKDYRYLDMQVTTLSPGTWFTLNFQTADSCQGPVPNNYVKPMLGMNLTAKSQTTFRVDVPPGIGQKLVAISIEDLQPFSTPVMFSRMRLLCAPIDQPNHSVRTGGGLVVLLSGLFFSLLL